MDAMTIPPPAPITVDINDHPSTSTMSKASSASLSIIIISAIVAIAFIILCIRRCIRCYFLHYSHGSSYRLPVYRTRSNDNTANTSALLECEILKLINSLPVITLASYEGKLPKSIHECAVCCDPFYPDSELRLLPACRHAFHKDCVDRWLKSNPSCPMCRSSITLPYKQLQDLSSGSFRIELGNVSLKRSESNSSQIQNQIVVPIRTYSMESYDYHIQEEIEIAQPRVPNGGKRIIEISDIAPRAPTPPVPSCDPPLPPQPPTPEPPEPSESPVLPIGSLDREEPVRGWLQEFLDTLSSAASSRRFPSQRWSERWSGRWSQPSSQRFDAGIGNEPPPDTWLCDLEAGQNEEAAFVLATYRWVAGV